MDSILIWSFRFNACVLSLFVLSLRRDSNKNSSNPCSYLRRALEKTRQDLAVSFCVLEKNDLLTGQAQLIFGKGVRTLSKIFYVQDDNIPEVLYILVLYLYCQFYIIFIHIVDYYILCQELTYYVLTLINAGCLLRYTLVKPVIQVDLISCRQIKR